MHDADGGSETSPSELLRCNKVYAADSFDGINDTNDAGDGISLPLLLSCINREPWSSRTTPDLPRIATWGEPAFGIDVAGLRGLDNAPGSSVEDWSSDCSQASLAISDSGEGNAGGEPEPEPEPDVPARALAPARASEAASPSCACRVRSASSPPAPLAAPVVAYEGVSLVVSSPSRLPVPLPMSLARPPAVGGRAARVDSAKSPTSPDEPCC